jgi:pimeloyl-ACP methyl ester carboxylesterase
VAALDRWFEELLDAIDVSDFGAGLKDSILRLHRSADPEELGRLGEHLGDLPCPALVVRGSRDAYVGSGALDELGAALGGEVERWEVPGAGHWCLHDDPEVALRVIAFLQGKTWPPAERTPAASDPSSGGDR